MNEKKTIILLVEDEDSHADLIFRSFESATVPMDLIRVRNLKEASISIAGTTPGLIIADYLLKDGKGTELIPVNKEEHPYPIVIMTSHGDEEIAVQAMKAGAFDYIVKSVTALDDMPNICEKIMLEWNYTIRHKRVEKELKESEAKFRGILSSLYEGAVIIYDRDGKITSLWGTPEMDKRYGLRAVDSIGMSIREIVPPEHADQRVSEIHRVFDAGEKMVVDYMVVFPSGNFWHETSLSPMRDADDNIAAVVGFVRDITERKKMEDALLQSEKLKSLGAITAGVAHEFNNILAVVMGSAEVLDGGFKDEQELNRGLKAIIEASADGAGIVKRMLSFAKAELSISDHIFIDIQYLIKQAVEFTMPRWKNMAQADSKKYLINTANVVETPDIFCNPTEIREVFVNLINNSLDAMPDGGTITVSTRCVRSPAEQAVSKKENSLESKGNFVEIIYEDIGKGMPEEVRKKIFDPFFTTRRPMGTGLGMSIAYSIMKRHGGKIDVKSEVGKGTVFNLSIPIQKEVGQKTAPSEPVREIMTTNRRILVIDDEKEICTILDEFLTRSGHIVKAVNSGSEAIELSRRENFDLVICDLVMPDVTGYDVVKALNDLDKTPKICIATGWGEKLKPMDEESLTVDFIIKKPFNLSEIERKISDLCK